MSNLDILVLLLVVVLLFVKLKNLLGTRPEGEEQHVHLSKESADKLYDILMKEAKRNPKNQNKTQPEAETAPAELKPVDEEMGELDRTLAQIPDFNKARFQDAAQDAFQIITTAFNNSDVETLEMLVSAPILKKFQEVIEARRQDKITAETDFICFDEVEILRAEVTADGTARIAVRFVSQQVNVLRDSEGKVIEGDENYIQNITDVWTFERSIHSSTPNWILVSTKK